MFNLDDYYYEKISRDEYYDRRDYDFDCDYDYDLEQEHIKEVLKQAKAQLETKLYEVLENVNKSLEDEEINKIYSDEMIQETLEEMIEYFFDNNVEVNISTNHKKIIEQRLQGLRG